MSCGVSCRRGSDPALLWLWRRPVATALIRPLAWEPPYAARAAHEIARQKKKNVLFIVGHGPPKWKVFALHGNDFGEVVSIAVFLRISLMREYGPHGSLEYMLQLAGAHEIDFLTRLIALQPRLNLFK